MTIDDDYEKMQNDYKETKMISKTCKIPTRRKQNDYRDSKQQRDKTTTNYSKQIMTTKRGKTTITCFIIHPWCQGMYVVRYLRQCPVLSVTCTKWGDWGDSG